MSHAGILLEEGIAQRRAEDGCVPDGRLVAHSVEERRDPAMGPGVWPSLS